MPFVQRVVEPKFLSRTSLRDEDGRPRVTDEELQAVTNCTLSNALRQLASLVLLAEDIFSELTAQLQGITERSKVAQAKIEVINGVVEKYDPKKSEYVSTKVYPMFPRYTMLKDMIKDIMHDPDYMEVCHEVDP
ncbi:wiskott-Aldrich syndrome protein family member 1-like [Leguminivora glycinivorella]|uniref:wiskott-Aldrich syndrome protein family member 1-like n=1 Tax=Leguminivora glycinivorella TaxID=1035111 RepID=UPI00200CAC31|nr:wiskott-Aldrich syndrome protein family member 1-like [Leguminivora glycinivorella]